MANNTSKIIALLIAAVLPFGNITLLFGIQDGFSVICIIPFNDFNCRLEDPKKFSNSKKN